MAIFNVTAPNGKTYRVDAPEGTEEEQLYRYVQTIMGESRGQYGSNGPVDAPQTVEYGTEASRRPCR